MAREATRNLASGSIRHSEASEPRERVSPEPRGARARTRVARRGNAGLARGAAVVGQGAGLREKAAPSATYADV